MVVATGLACAAPANSANRCAEDAEVRSVRDAERYAGCEELPSLALSGGVLTEPSGLRGLRSIVGTLRIGATSRLSSTDLPALTTVGGDVVIRSNFELGGVFLSALERVGGKLSIAGNPSLRGVAIAKLRLVGDELNIDSNPMLESVLLPALEEVEGNLLVSGSRRLSIAEVNVAARVRGKRHIELATSRNREDSSPLDPQSPTPTLPE